MILTKRSITQLNIGQKKYYTIGSTKDEVIAILGSPDEYNECEFVYGF